MLTLFAISKQLSKQRSNKCVRTAYTVSGSEVRMSLILSFTLYFSSSGTPLELIHAIKEQARQNKNQFNEKLFEDKLLLNNKV